MQWVPEAITLGVKRPGREAGHSPPSSAEVNAWSYISIPQYVFMAWCLVKHRDSFAFTFIMNVMYHLTWNTNPPVDPISDQHSWMFKSYLQLIKLHLKSEVRQ
jgi:hypothetical protein